MERRFEKVSNNDLITLYGDARVAVERCTANCTSNNVEDIPDPDALMSAETDMINAEMELQYRLAHTDFT